VPRGTCGLVIGVWVLALTLMSCSAGQPTSSSSAASTTGAPSGASTPPTKSPGVTATTVTVGQVDDLTAPLPGLFKGAEDGTQAYFDLCQQ